MQYRHALHTFFNKKNLLLPERYVNFSVKQISEWELLLRTLKLAAKKKEKTSIKTNFPTEKYHPTL